ncbi:phenylacetate--CoA ligase family protein [Chloroflexota bacterium]
MSRRDHYAPILRNRIYPLAQRLQGRDFHTAMNAAQRDQFLSSDEVRALQFRKMSALIPHTFQTVPHYRQAFGKIGLEPGDIKTWEDFKNIPILTKELLRENGETLISSKPDSALYPITTSGSTGLPLKTMVSQRAALRANVSRIRSLKWWGIELGDREIRLTNTGLSFKRGWKKFYSEYIRTPMRTTLMNRKYFSSLSMTPKMMGEHWKAILKFSPRYLFGFPSAYALFANYLHEKGYDGREANLKLVLTLGEILHEWQEQLITTTFGCPMADEYGSTEVGVIAYSHPCGAMHTMDDGVIVEIIKSNPDDEYGQVVVTNLDNWGYPIIRFNLNDLAKTTQNVHDCSLGIGLGTLEGLVGRDQDVLRLASGRIVYYFYFYFLIEHVRGVRQYQVIQKKPDHFELKIIPDGESFNQEQENYIQDVIREHLEGSTISIKIVDNIPKDPSGKLRFVISEL